MSKTSTRVAKKRLGGDKEVLRNALQRRFREGHWRLPFSCCSLVDSYVYSYHEGEITHTSAKPTQKFHEHEDQAIIESYELASWTEN